MKKNIFVWCGSVKSLRLLLKGIKSNLSKIENGEKMTITEYFYKIKK